MGEVRPRHKNCKVVHVTNVCAIAKKGALAPLFANPIKPGDVSRARDSAALDDGAEAKPNWKHSSTPTLQVASIGFCRRELRRIVGNSSEPRPAPEIVGSEPPRKCNGGVKGEADKRQRRWPGRHPPEQVHRKRHAANKRRSARSAHCRSRLLLSWPWEHAAALEDAACCPVLVRLAALRAARPRPVSCGARMWLLYSAKLCAWVAVDALVARQNGRGARFRS